ncbi:MAG TPA: hypothetical protein PLP29_04815 [Candidatus Ozemobacteraceae bacterium]|nr:hypothetical protein [Candidatus Ozemobacteraceae bacterium]
MLIWHQSGAGTIRESNQERWHLDEQLGLLALADGDGPVGRDLADLAIAAIGRRARMPHAGGSRIAGAPLRELLGAVHQEIAHARVSLPGGSASSVHLAVAWVRQGCLHAATSGKIGLMASIGGRVHRLEPQRLPTLAAISAQSADAHQAEIAKAPSPEEAETLFLDPLPVTVGDWILAASQGLLASQPLGEMQPLMPLVSDDPERLVNGLFAKASARYDGDDRTLVLARLLPSDITRTVNADAVISVDLDRRFTVPLWVPLVVAAVLAAIGTVIGRITRRFDG